MKQSNWTYLSNHGHVLICLARDPDARLRDVASAVGITERAVQRIVAELEEAGALTREREGRRNHYTLNCARGLRHSVEAGATIGDLIEAINEPPAQVRRTAIASMSGIMAGSQIAAVGK